MMSNPYWNDDLITAEVDDLSLDENSSDYLEANEKVRRLMRKMRDAYENQLEAQLFAVEEMAMKPGELEVKGLSPLIVAIVASCRNLLEEHDAPNYVQLEMHPRGGGRGVHITVAWADGKLPATRVKEMEEEVERLRALLPDAETRKALRAIMEFRSDHWSRAPVAAWLEKLESEVGHNE